MRWQMYELNSPQMNLKFLWKIEKNLWREVLSATIQWTRRGGRS